MPRPPRPARAPSDRGSIDFGGFRETPRTAWRPAMPTFAPQVRLTERMHEAMRAIERADHELARLAPARGGLLQRIRREALARNAFATASIEGNPLTLPEVESLLRSNPSPAAVRDPHELEILNYVHFMATPEARKAPREPEDVLRVHAALFRQVFPDAGRWKQRPNFIGRRADMSVVYVPTAPERVEAELAGALAWLHEAREHPPLLRALLFHHEFESIHPFRDGNGRVGRALTPMLLHAFGYEGSAFTPIDHHVHGARDSYYAQLAKVEQEGFQDYTGWLEYMLGVVEAAYAEAVRAALFQRALPADLPERQRAVAEWFAHLHHEDPGRRVKFHDVHHAFPEVAERTLKRDLTRLRDAGVLDVEGQLKGTTYRLRAE